MTTTSPRRGGAPAPAIVISGMHRSGTSLMASLLHSAGVHVGERLMPPSPANPLGYFEDLDFVDFHRRALRANGYTDDGILADCRIAVPESLQQEARALVDARKGSRSPWGWKDPRSVLFLHLWRRILPDAAHAFVFRSPWEVIDSLYRRGTDEPVCVNPPLALDCWLHYNTLIRDFVKRHRDTCMLVEVRDILARPEAVIAWARQRFGVALADPKAIGREDLLTSLADSSREAFIRECVPHAADLYEELRGLASGSGGVRRAKPLARVRPSEGVVAMALCDWSAVHDQRRQAAHFRNAAIAAESAQAVLQQDADALRRDATESRCVHERLVARIAELDAREAARNADLADLHATIESLRSDAAHRDPAPVDHAPAISAAAPDEPHAGDAIGSLSARLSALEADVDAMRSLVTPAPAGEAGASHHGDGNGHAPQAADPDAAGPVRGYPPANSPTETTRMPRAAAVECLFGVEYRGTLRAQAGLKALAATAAASQWMMTDDDPQFELSFPDLPSLPTGYYDLRIDLPPESRSPSPFWRPRLYVDYGAGYREEDSMPLAFRRCRTGVACTVLVRATARGLRFDPSARPGPLLMGHLFLKRISRPHYYAGAMHRLLKRKATTPATVWSTLNRAGRVLRTGGVKALAAAVRQADLQGLVESTSYGDWIGIYDRITATDRARMHAMADRLAVRPLISIVMPTYNTPPHMLRMAIDSVLAQTYDRWELCIADDMSTQPVVRKILDDYAARDSRIKVAYRPANGHIAAATNTAIDLATGEWISFLDHDDALAPHALFCMADAIARHPHKHLFYSDEDKIDAANVRHDPYFKSDWNPDLVRSHNLVTHMAVYRASRLRQIGGMRTGFDGAQDYDLVLRFTERMSPDDIHHVPHVLYHWRVHSSSTAASSAAKPYAMQAGERALNEHLSRCGIAASAHLIGFGYRVDYALPKHLPPVTIIIPTRNAHALVSQCVESIFARTTYGNYEILLVDNGSDEPASLACFAALGQDARVRVLRDDGPFNFSALNNAAAREARGDVLVLLNNDIQVISPDWLNRLVGIALQPGVGAVGAKLLYPDDTIQHGGVIMGLGGLAAHAHTGFHRSSPGYVGRAALQQSVSAVTGACLAVRKDLYFRVGGLDERHLAIAYNDVDFCLKLARLGLRNVWTPFAELYHHESATRGYETTPEKQRRFEAEKEVMRTRWKDVIAHDPAYNPNLTDSRADFTLAWPPRVTRPWHDADDGGD